MKIAIVLTNYNNSKLTCDAVKSILDQRSHDCMIVIVDNDSDEHNKNILNSLSADFESVKEEENLNSFFWLNLINRKNDGEAIQEIITIWIKSNIKYLLVRSTSKSG